jgi:hypothetical protein
VAQPCEWSHGPTRVESSTRLFKDTGVNVNSLTTSRRTCLRRRCWLADGAEMYLSLELLPVPLIRGVAGSATARVLAQLPRGTLVYLPNLPNDPPDAIEHALRHLRCSAPHLEPVPHIAAQRVPSEAELLRRLDNWQAATNHQLSEVCCSACVLRSVLRSPGCVTPCLPARCHTGARGARGLGRPARSHQPASH